MGQDTGQLLALAIIGVLLVLLLVLRQTRLKRQAPQPARPPRLWTAALGASVLFVLDAIILNQGVIAVLVFSWQVLVRLPVSLQKRFAPIRRQRLRNIAVLAGAALLVIVANVANNRIASARARQLVAVIEDYTAQRGELPKRLDELVPEFLDEIPCAKYSLWNQFHYFRTEDGAILFYTSIPPFGRPTYSFKDRRWSFMD